MDDITFDPEVEEIEKKLIKFFGNSPIFLGHKIHYTHIFSYLVTRRRVTQKQLKDLTNFSSGKISQELNVMLETGKIEVVDISKTGEKTYSVVHAKTALSKLFVDLLRGVVEWEEKFARIKSDLEKNKETLEKLNGYNKIYAKVSELLEINEIYNRLIQIFEEA